MGKDRSKGINRRDFIVGAAGLAVTAGIAGCSDNGTSGLVDGLIATPDQGLADGSTPSPDKSLTDRSEPASPIDDLRVVYATDKSMITSTPTLWSYTTQNAAVAAAVVSTNMDKMAMALAQKSAPSAAWKTIFTKPSSKAWSDVKMLIKVNCVYSACTPRHAVVKKVCEVAVNTLGMKGDNVCVYDVDSTAHSGHHPGIAGTYASYTSAYPFPTGVRLSANGFTGQKSTVSVPGGTVTTVPVLKDLVDGTADILVNIGVNKGHYQAGNVTLCQKNHIGSLKFFCPGKTSSSQRNTYMTDSAKDLVALNQTAAIVGGTPRRQQLCILDSLWAMKSGPSGGGITHEPATLVMGRHGGAVDYLSEKMVRDKIMNCASRLQSDINTFITGYGYTDAQRQALTAKTPADNYGRGWVNALV